MASTLTTLYYVWQYRCLPIAVSETLLFLSPNHVIACTDAQSAVYGKQLYCVSSLIPFTFCYLILSLSRRRPYMFLLLGRGSPFLCYSGMTLPLCIGHKFSWQFYYNGPQEAWYNKVDIQVFLLVCLSSFFTLAYRPNGLIFQNVVEAEELMLTESSTRAMTFWAMGHVVG